MIKMALRLAAYDLRAFARNRQSRFFTVALPVLFLVIFASVFGGQGQVQAGLVGQGAGAAADDGRDEEQLVFVDQAGRDSHGG